MQTLKIKYQTSEENKPLIREYQRQYSNVLHCAYNRAKENLVDKHITDCISTLNNISLMECFFIRSAVKESISMVKAGQDKVIFGGKKNFIDRCQNKISKKEFMEKRLSPIYSMGEANQKGNRKFQINQDCNSFVFKPNRNTHIQLEIKDIRNCFPNSISYRKPKQLPYRINLIRNTSISVLMKPQFQILNQ